MTEAEIRASKREHDKLRQFQRDLVHRNTPTRWSWRWECPALLGMSDTLFVFDFAADRWKDAAVRGPVASLLWVC